MSHMWMRHVKRTNESCHTCETCGFAMSWLKCTITYEWVMSCVCISHITRMNESCDTYKWVMSHMWMSHVTRMNESCYTRAWVRLNVWMSHVNQVNESCHTCEWVTSHLWMSHVTHMNQPCQTFEWVMPRSQCITGAATDGHNEWVMSLMDESWDKWMSPGTYE